MSLGGRPAPVLGGFTGDQRFFTDPHSPGEWRAAEVHNVDAWYAAFDIKPGMKMYLPPEKRVKVW